MGLSSGAVLVFVRVLWFLCCWCLVGYRRMEGHGGVTAPCGGATIPHREAAAPHRNAAVRHGRATALCGGITDRCGAAAVLARECDSPVRGRETPARGWRIPVSGRDVLVWFFDSAVPCGEIPAGLLADSWPTIGVARAANAPGVRGGSGRVWGRRSLARRLRGLAHCEKETNPGCFARVILPETEEGGGGCTVAKSVCTFRFWQVFSERKSPVQSRKSAAHHFRAARWRSRGVKTKQRAR